MKINIQICQQISWHALLTIIIFLQTLPTGSALRHGYVSNERQDQFLVVNLEHHDSEQIHDRIRRASSTNPTIVTPDLLSKSDNETGDNQNLKAKQSVNSTDSFLKVKDKISDKTQDSKNHTLITYDRDYSLNNSMINLVHLNVSHEQLTVLWAGKNSPVIICLAKNRKNSRKNQSSAVFISHNYGESFDLIDSLKLKNGTQAIISGFYMSSILNSFYIFVDSTNNYLFITKDYGRNFQFVELSFKPKLLQLHHTIPNMIIAQSINHTSNDSSLYLSENFGLTWSLIQEKITFSSWSIEGIDLGKTLKRIFFVRREPSGTQTLLISEDLFRNVSTLLTDVTEVEIHGRFIFATRKLKLFGSHERDNYQLWISIDRKEFVRAQIRTIGPAPIDYHIADVTSDIIFICATFKNGQTNLYSSFSNFEDYTLSLENILYFNSKITKYYPGLNYETISEQKFADLHRISGIRGTYIVSKWKNSARKSVSDIVSLITYDMGNRWHQLKPPSIDAFGRNLTCNQSNIITNQDISSSILPSSLSSLPSSLPSSLSSSILSSSSSSSSSKSQCSLHLVQKYHSLSTNVKTILTRDSSVGFILATGVVGTSLKGKQSIYLSVDSGITWRQILSGNYLYAIGDFGAIIVAVAHFSKGGLTNELYYSIDDGESFHMMKFSKEKIRVYSLFTEPGEKTTVFTIFGSKDSPHEWIVLQANFTSLFKGQCQISTDYKEWSPHDFESDCLLGSTQIFQRRIASHKCFNGDSFIRPSVKINCPCKHADYECDIGFISGNKTHALKCIKDENSNIDLDAIPDSCRPGKMFNKTKGYRRINGDTCEGGEEDWYSPQMLPCPFDSSVGEFMLFVQRQDISMISLNGDNYIKESLVPKNFISNAIAADFDIKKNCLFWSDITLNRILRLCLDGRPSHPEVLVENELYSVEGIVFNQINRHLYFVNGFRSKVELIDVDSIYEGKMRRTIISKPEIDKPRGIAIDPVEGYLFITDWSTSTPSIIRSDLDGEDIRVLFTSDTVTWPNGITVDHRNKQIFWVDAKHDYIAMSNFDGKNLKFIIKGDQAPHPFALGVFKDAIFYDDWNLHKLIMISKHNSSIQKIILSDVNGGMDLKIITPFFNDKNNICNYNGTCTHLCLVKPFNAHRCLCPDGFNVSKNVSGDETCSCAEHHELSRTGICRPTASANITCSENEFTCANGNCISRFWKCDGDDDCEDNSDETHCTNSECKSTEFACASNGKCVLDLWICDHEKECEDGSDEDIKICAIYFPKCNNSSDFQCANYRCINKSQVCDHLDDCHDGSDELQCRYHSTSENVTCEKNHFQCAIGDCIPRSWQCDSFNDCSDHSDEANCTNFKCSEGKFSCDNNICIDEQYVCDNQSDCSNGADERNCTNISPNSTIHQILPETNSETETNDFFRDGHCLEDWLACQNNRCIPLKWHCDGNKDCKDGSDEEGCYDIGGMSFNVSTISANTNNDQSNIIKSNTCEMPGKFHCYRSNQCINALYVCDADLDCTHGEDELYCKSDMNYHCPNDEFSCILSFGCVPLKQLCNGKRDCPDGSDEWTCDKSSAQFPSSTSSLGSVCHGFQCASGECISHSERCNDKIDCFDRTDEMNCDQKEINVYDLHVLHDSIKTNSFTIVWRSPNDSQEFIYMPAYSHYDDESIKVNTSWIKDERYTFTELNSGTRYKVFVYVKLLSHAHTTTDASAASAAATDADAEDVNKQDSIKVDDVSKVFIPTNFIKVTTAFLVPDAPTNLIVKEIGYNKISIEWSSPENTNEPIIGYKIYHSPPFPASSKLIEASHQQRSTTTIKEDNNNNNNNNNKKNNNSNIDINIKNNNNKRKKNHQFIMSDIFEVGMNYTFWMTTITISLESSESNKAFIIISPAAKIIDLNTKSITNTSVQLEWKYEPNRIAKWFITYTCPEYFSTFIGNFTTSKTNVQISNLSPGVKYQFRIFPISNGIVLYDAVRDNIIDAKTLGNQLPSITINSKVHGNIVSLSWQNAGSYNNQNNIDWEYAIYVGTKLSDLKPYARTRDTKLVLKNLYSCELYLIQIRVVEPFGFGPSLGDYKVKTLYDPTSPPKLIRTEPINSDRTKYRISWNASCSNVDTPLGYIVSINDIVYGREDRFVLRPSLNCCHSLDLSIHYGASYQIRIATDQGEETRWSDSFTLTPPSMPRIARPRAYMDELGKIFIVWKTLDNFPKDHQIHRLKYKVFIAGEENADDLSKGETMLANQPPVIHQPKIVKNIFYIAVALIDNHGYTGPLSESFALIKDDMVVSPIFDQPTASSSGVTLLYCLVFVLVLAIILLPLSYYFGRNSRWHIIGRPSVLVNSHYNSRLDSATLSPYDNVSTDEDLPVFADDEPLVNA